LITMTMHEAFAAYQSVAHRLPRVGPPALCQLAANLDAIADDFDVFLLDAFGVLNIGESPIAGTPERVAGLQSAGKRVLVVSNAAGQPHSVLMAKYARLGYNFAADDVISSRRTILHALKSEPERRWGIMANESLGREDLDALDFAFLGDDPSVYDTVEAFLFLGSTTWTLERQAMLRASLAKAPRPVLVGNPDIVAPREDGFSVEPGRYAHLLADQTGIAPRFYGKPFRNIFDLAFARLDPATDPARILMVGDSLHTDVLGGQAAGIKTALIAGYGFFAGHDVFGPIRQSGIEPDYILDRP
jgi:glycerol 3-phosphatase-2